MCLRTRRFFHKDHCAKLKPKVKEISATCSVICGGCRNINLSFLLQRPQSHPPPSSYVLDFPGTKDKFIGTLRLPVVKVYPKARTIPTPVKERLGPNAPSNPLFDLKPKSEETEGKKQTSFHSAN